MASPSLFLGIGMHHSVHELWLIIDQNIDHFSGCLYLLSELSCLEKLSIQTCDKNVPEGIFEPVRPVHLRKLVFYGKNESQITSCLKLFKGSSIHSVSLQIWSDVSEELPYVLHESLPHVRQVNLDSVSIVV